MSLIRVGLIGTLVAALMLHSGCSFLFVKGPPEQHAQMATFDCSDSNAWPVVDAIWAALNGIGAASAAGDDTNPDQGRIVGVGIAWLVVSGASAIYGFSKVGDCKKARRAREERGLARVPAASPASEATASAGPAPTAARAALSSLPGAALRPRRSLAMRLPVTAD